MEKVATSSERLKTLMQQLSISQSDIVKATGLTKSAISQYVNGQREPRQDAIGIICEKYRINPAWFMGYDDSMFLNMKHEEIPTYLPEIQEMVDILPKLTTQQRELLLQTARQFLNQNDDK